MPSYICFTSVTALISSLLSSKEKKREQVASCNMDVMESEYRNYWDTQIFLETEDLASWIIGEAISGYYSSSPSVVVTTPKPPRYVVMERNRREKLKERLFALRSVVPHITKMDKASIIKDAIDYIQELQDQERKLQSEISVLELLNEPPEIIYDIERYDERRTQRKRKRTSPSLPLAPESPSIEVLELRVSAVDGKTLVLNFACIKKRSTLVKMCEVFESLNLKIITANFTSSSGSLSYTLVIETDELDGDGLKEKFEAAIAELDFPRSP